MTRDQVSFFLALLAVLAELAVVIALVLAIGGLFSERLARARGAAAAAVGPQALWLAFAVATVSMLGSLYFSEIAHFLPCRLCWYQRFCMYPLVPILGVAAWRRATAVRPYASVLAGIGAAISSYHVVLEHYPNLESSVCAVNNPCSLIWVRRFGYLTIPTMALSGFVLILTLLAIARSSPDPETVTTSTSATRSEHSTP